MLGYKMKRETLNCLLSFLLGYVISQMMAKKSCCGGHSYKNGDLIEGSNCDKKEGMCVSEGECHEHIS